MRQDRTRRDKQAEKIGERREMRPPSLRAGRVITNELFIDAETTSIIVFGLLKYNYTVLKNMQFMRMSWN